MRPVNIYILACIFCLIMLLAGISCRQSEDAGIEGPANIERTVSQPEVTDDGEGPADADVDWDAGGEVSGQESVNWDEGTSSFKMDDSMIEGIVLGDGAGEGEDLEIPEEWPNEVPVPEGYGLRRVQVNPDGSLAAAFMGEGSLEDLSALFAEALAEWDVREPNPMPDMDRQALALSWFDGENTVDMTAWRLEDNGKVILNLDYNMRTAPGVLPAGWPDDIPLMPGLEVESGMVIPDGTLTVTLVGTVPIEEIADWYMNNMEGWMSALPEGMGPFFEDFMMMGFMRDGEEVSVTGNIPERGSPVLVAITWVPVE